MNECFNQFCNATTDDPKRDKWLSLEDRFMPIPGDWPERWLCRDCKVNAALMSIQ